jgi:hypothetical protein
MYLGVWISRNRKFDKVKKYLSLQSKKVTFALKKCLMKLKSPPVPVSLRLYNSIVKPALCYGCEFWGFVKDDEIEKIELHFMKYILHLPTNAAVHGELGQFPLQLFWKERILKYWCRVNSSESPHHVQQAVKVQLRMSENGRICWLTKTKQLYNAAGQPHKFFMAGTETTNEHVNELMTTLSDQYVQEWTTQLNVPGGRREQ